MPKNILGNDSRTRILPDMEFAMESTESKELLFCIDFREEKDKLKKCKIPATYSGCLGNQYTSLGTQTQKALFKFFSPLYFNKKYVQEEIDDFTMHLIISKWLQGQKYWQKRKTIKQKEVQRKEETVWECFY